MDGLCGTSLVGTPAWLGVPGLTTPAPEASAESGYQRAGESRTPQSLRALERGRTGAQQGLEQRLAIAAATAAAILGRGQGDLRPQPSF